MGVFRLSCAEVLERLEAYCDKETSGWDRVRIERHLTVCGDCLGRKEFRLALSRIVRDTCGKAQLPPALAERIRRDLSSAG
jgi:mycothiol system anti-sigma-R factor